MGTEIADIEHHYQVTLQSTKKEDVDFWGINLMDVPGHELSYKVYRSQASSQCASHPLVDYIHRRGMLRYFADVADSTRPGVTRIDISLYQRNDANMESLFEYLTKYVPFFQPHVC